MNDRVVRLGTHYTWVHLLDADSNIVCGVEVTQSAILEPHADIEDEERDICKKCLQVEAKYSVQRLRGGQVRRYGSSEWFVYRHGQSRAPARPRRCFERLHAPRSQSIAEARPQALAQDVCQGIQED